jgi:tripartite ATP-independent transporter DctP family solute receptor
MKKQKIIMISLMLLSLLIVVMGCSSGGAKQSVQTQTTNAEGSSKPNAKVDIRFGYEATTDHPGHKAALKFAETLDKNTNGRIKVNLFPNSQLGAGNELMTSLMNGSIQMGATATFGTVEQKLLVTDMPYMFRDFDHISKFIHSDVSTKLLSVLDSHGVHGMGYWMVGFRNIGNNKHPVKTPEDLKGLLIRGFDNEMLKDTLGALGANVTIVPYPEVYMALRTGTINGEENPYVNTAAMKFYEAEKYKTETRHMNNFNIVATNLKWWNSLSKEDQDTITKAFLDATDYYMELQKNADEQSKKALIEKGMEIVEIKDYKPWEDAVKPVFDKWEKKFGADLISSIKGIK